MIALTRLQSYQGYLRWRRDRSLKATRLSRLLERYVGKGFSMLQSYQGYRRGMLRYVSQGYKAIKATGGGHRNRSLKATRLSRLQEGDAEISFSRLHGYQGYWRGM